MYSFIVLALAFSGTSYKAEPTVVTVPEVVITAPAVKGTERFVCDPQWLPLQSSTGSYRNCNTFTADGKGNWINRDYKKTHSHH
jgi:hypothetical protein